MLAREKRRNCGDRVGASLAHLGRYLAPYPPGAKLSILLYPPVILPLHFSFQDLFWMISPSVRGRFLPTLSLHDQPGFTGVESIRKTSLSSGFLLASGLDGRFSSRRHFGLAGLSGSQVLKSRTKRICTFRSWLRVSSCPWCPSDATRLYEKTARDVETDDSPYDRYTPWETTGSTPEARGRCAFSWGL